MNTSLTKQVVERLMATYQPPIKNPTELAKLCGVPQPTLSRLFNGKHDAVRLETLQALAVFFRVTVSHLLGEIALDPDPNVDKLIKDYRESDERGKQVLINLAQSQAQYVLGPLRSDADSVPVGNVERGKKE